MKMDFSLIYHLKLQPSEIDRLPFYRLEYLIEDLKEYKEEEKKAHEEQEGKYSKSVDYKSQQSAMMREARQSMPSYGSSMPSLPSGMRF